MTKQYICIKAFPLWKVGAVVERGNWTYHEVADNEYESKSMPFDAVENNPEYFKEVEPEKEEKKYADEVFEETLAEMEADGEVEIDRSGEEDIISLKKEEKIGKDLEQCVLEIGSAGNFINGVRLREGNIVVPVIVATPHIEEIQEQEQPKEEKQEGKLWRAEVGEIYWYMPYGRNVSSHTDSREFLDTEMRTAGNYYRTKEDAQTVLEYTLCKTRLEDKIGWIIWASLENNYRADSKPAQMARDERNERYDLHEGYLKAQKNRFINNTNEDV